MENYKEKCEQYLERAKQELDACGSLNCDAARQIFRLFPELQSIKNEKIKNNIIKLLRFVRDTYHQYSDECNEAIAWLEKQGKQKPIDKVEPKFKVGSQEYPLTPSECFKPAWSEEDEKIYQSIIDDTVQENQLDDKQINWLKSIKDRIQPRPKQEMTELQLEDTKAYQEGVKEGRRLERQDIDKELDEAYKSRDEVVYLEGYDKGYEDALKDLPKWKRAIENKEFEKHVCVMDYYMSPFLDTEVNEGDYYIELSDLKTLPKEE